MSSSSSSRDRCRARERVLPVGTGKVIGLAGVRRAGKTFLFFHTCTEDGTAFWNSCWSLADPATVGREQAAMALGNSRSKQATGLLLYHESAPALMAALPAAQPAWRWLLEQRPGNIP